MHPRTVKMAAEVASQLSAADVDEYGNIIKNGYLSVVPNTTNKKAWQYQETTTAPVDLPSLTETRPAYRGWTTNYMQYYTRPSGPVYQEGNYAFAKPGMPTMFDFNIANTVGLLCPIVEVTLIGAPENGSYAPGVYTGLTLRTSPLVFGQNAKIDITVDADGKISYWAINTPGAGYRINERVYILATDIGGTAGRVDFKVKVQDVEKGRLNYPRYMNPSHRFNQLAVDNVSTPQYINNPAVIQYSFLHPIKSLYTLNTSDSQNTPGINWVSTTP